MADTMRPGGHVSSMPRNSQIPPMASLSMEGDLGTPAVFRFDSQDSAHPHLTHLTLRADTELRVLLHALQTRADIDDSRLEASHRRDIASVCTDITSLTERMGTGKAMVTALEKRLKQVKDTQAIQAASVLAQQLHLEKIEDRSRRNNL